MTINASDAAGNVEQLWQQAAKEPVTVTKGGQVVAVVLSPAEFARLTARRRAKAGFAKHLFQGVDPNAVLNISAEDEFAEYQ